MSLLKAIGPYGHGQYLGIRMTFPEQIPVAPRSSRSPVQGDGCLRCGASAIVHANPPLCAECYQAFLDWSESQGN